MWLCVCCTKQLWGKKNEEKNAPRWQKKHVCVRFYLWFAIVCVCVCMCARACCGVCVCVCVCVWERERERERDCGSCVSVVWCSGGRSTCVSSYSELLCPLTSLMPSCFYLCVLILVSCFYVCPHTSLMFLYLCAHASISVRLQCRNNSISVLILILPPPLFLVRMQAFMPRITEGEVRVLMIGKGPPSILFLFFYFFSFLSFYPSWGSLCWWQETSPSN